MSNALGRVLERRSLRHAVERALDSGIGLYRTRWRLTTSFDARLVDDVVDWCREVVSKTHRPYGIGSVSLAVAVQRRGNLPPISRNYPLLSTSDFYGDSMFQDELRSGIIEWARAGLLAQGGMGLSVTLFSWGDLARELLLAGQS